jgi:hypothetical protein
MLSLQNISIVLATLALAACADNLGQPTTEIADPPAPGVNDTDLPVSSHKSSSPISNLGAPGEIAFGDIDAAGTKLSGTANWTSVFNASLTRYEITITGESYFFSSYATMVTPLGDVRFCHTGSISGKLTIDCTDAAGTPATSRLAFVTFKP